MSQISVEVPDILANLSPQERERLIRSGLYEATQARIEQIKKELDESEKHRQHFQNKYGLPLAQFEAEMLPTLDSVEAHEDYNDWFYWETVWHKNKNLLTELSQIEFE